MHVGVCAFGLLVFGVMPTRTAMLSSSGHSLRVCPVDTVVIAGTTVHLRCTAHPNDTIRWFRGSESKPNARCIYKGNGFYEYAVDMNRFSIRADRSTGTADLFIANVRPEDVGVYLCTGLQSNTRGLVKLAIVEHLVNETSLINLSSNTVIRQCNFRYFGPLKPSAEWLDVKDNPTISSFSESNETEGLVTTSTNDPSAAVCRLSFQLTSCGHPAPSVHIRSDDRRLKKADRTGNMSVVSTDGTDRTLLIVWAWTASIVAVVSIFTTVAMCCVICANRRRRQASRPTSCKQFGFANSALISSLVTVNDKPRKPTNNDDRTMQSGHDASMDSGFDFVTDTQMPTRTEYEGLKFDGIYTQLMHRPTDNINEATRAAVEAGTRSN